MKPTSTVLLLAALVCATLAVRGFAQRPANDEQPPVSRLFIAEAKGDAEVTTAEQVHPGQQADSFDAPGTVIETKADSHLAFVLSNGTGILLDADSRMRIDRFEQDSFRARLSALDAEPSISRTAVFLARGFLGVSTAEMASGSSMVYLTPHGLAKVRGRIVAIETNPENSVVYLLDGDVTVETLDAQPLSQLVRPGQQATIWPGPPSSIVITEIAPAKREMLLQRLGLATNARRTVSFESRDGAAAGAEIVARPTVPAQVPPHLSVSPDRLPGT